MNLKSKCEDIFLFASVDGRKMYPDKSYKEFKSQKIEKSRVRRELL